VKSYQWFMAAVMVSWIVFSVVSGAPALAQQRTYPRLALYSAGPVGVPGQGTTRTT